MVGLGLVCTGLLTNTHTLCVCCHCRNKEMIAYSNSMYFTAKIKTAFPTRVYTTLRFFSKLYYWRIAFIVFKTETAMKRIERVIAETVGDELSSLI